MPADWIRQGVAAGWQWIYKPSNPIPTSQQLQRFNMERNAYKEQVIEAVRGLQYRQQDRNPDWDKSDFLRFQYTASDAQAKEYAYKPRALYNTVYKYHPYNDSLHRLPVPPYANLFILNLGWDIPGPID